MAQPHVKYYSDWHMHLFSCSHQDSLAMLCWYITAAEIPVQQAQYFSGLMLPLLLLSQVYAPEILTEA